MTAKYLHQDLSCIYRLHHACSEKLHFWQSSGADCSSGLASEKMTVLKGLCVMLYVTDIQVQTLKTYHDGIVVDEMKTHLWRKMFTILPGSFTQKNCCFENKTKQNKTKQKAHTLNNSYKKWNSSPGPFK